MPQKPSRLLYVLIAAVAALSLWHAVAGAIGNVETILSEKTLRPFDTKFGTPVVGSALEQTRRAGLQVGDTVLAINGQPYTGFAQVFAVTREIPPGVPVTITFRRGPAEEAAAETIQVAAVGQGSRTVWGLSLQVLFLVLPLLALLTGLYVLMARPGTFVAWLVFAILAYAASVFFSVQFMPPALAPVAMVWAEFDPMVMPIALLLFAIHFPERANFDRRYPWVKWVLIAPQLLLFPVDLAAQYEGIYHVPVARWLVAAHERAQPVETVAAVGSILLFFTLLGTRMGTSTGDARRRLRVLYYGAIAGLAPVFLLVILATVRRTRFAEGVPEAVKLIAISMLLILPVSLAYVVVVQRAMELRILIRQGTKYFFARQSVAAVRVALTVWMAWVLAKFFRHPERRGLVDVIEVLGVIVLFAAYRLVLGGRLQQWVDRRFFRDAYSAEQVLSELSDEARNFTEVEPLLATVTERIGATLHIERIAVFLRTGESFVLQLATGSALAMPALALPAGSATITTLSREKRPSVLYRNDPQSWLVEATAAERSALQDLSAELLVPLPGRNRLLGVMTLGPKRSEEPYSRSDRQLLQSVASQTGLALENAELLENLTVEIAQRERMASEIEIAREVQERLFPQSYPVIPGVDMAGFCRPAQAVGGDYYDMFVVGGDGEPSGHRLALAVGDISGKGISASLLMASLRASLRSLARMESSTEQMPDLAGLMRQVNHLVFEASTSNRYATFFFAEFDPGTRMLTYVNAGHNPPMVLRGETVLTLSATGMVIGLLEHASFEQSTIQLEAGDVLLAYTDGISEAMNAAEDEWGEDRMIAAAHRLIGEPGCTRSAVTLIECLFREADGFTAGAAQHDDMTLLICAIDRAEEAVAGADGLARQ